jgi:gliding motility-associated-like protein
LSQTRYLIFLSFPFHLFHKLVQNYLLNKAFYIFLFILLFRSEAKTQTNLVYNGDFEIYSSCPFGISTPGNVQMTKCTGWVNPTDATPDYFNVCNNSGGSVVGIPYNSLGFQYSNSGNGYMGIIAFENVDTSYWYEYIQGELTAPLIKDKYYDVSFYAVVADGYADVALKNIGAYFSSNSFLVTGSQKLNVLPQIKNSNFITDTLNWTKIYGSFKATGGESFITIGYFDNITTDTIRVANIPPSGVSSYYYIDAVELSESPDSMSSCILNIPNIFTPNNDSINDQMYFKTCSKIIKTTVYNRWGNLVFETDKQNRSWDGRTTSGEPCVEGNYFYIIETEEKTHKGFIQLIR